MSLSTDIQRLEAIIKEEQAEGQAKLQHAGISVTSGTIEEIIDKIPNGSTFASYIVNESASTLDTAFTTL